MKQLIQLAAVIALLTLSACAPKTENKAQPQSGGVDGSGGELPKIEQKSFDNWLRDYHPYMVRDLIHRLWWLKKNSPDDFRLLAHENLLQKLLGDDEKELSTLLKKIKYVSYPHGCASKDHPAGDGSAKAGEICLSHSAFKNIPYEKMISSLLALTMHEIAHLRGFDEEDADAIQYEFEKFNGLSRKTILSYNENYKYLRSNLKKMHDRLNFSLKNLLLREDTSHAKSCMAIAQAEERISEIYPLIDSAPRITDTNLREKVVKKIYKLVNRCMEKSEKEIAIELATILEGFSSIHEELNAYESPFCRNNNCDFVNVSSFRTLEGLTSWKAQKDFYLNDLAYPELNVTDVNCIFENLTDNISHQIEFSDDYSNVRFADLSNYEKEFIGFMYLRSETSATVRVDFNTIAPSKLISSTNFYGYQNGLLHKQSMEQAEITVATYDYLLAIETPLLSYSPYYGYSGFIKQDPVIKKEYKLSCSIKN